MRLRSPNHCTLRIKELAQIRFMEMRMIRRVSPMFCHIRPTHPLPLSFFLKKKKHVFSKDIKKELKREPPKSFRYPDHPKQFLKRAQYKKNQGKLEKA